MLAPAGASAPEWADRACALLAPYPALLLAVSGGPDSVALMLLAAHYLSSGDRRLAVATVDHGLRDGSAQEAKQVGAWAQALALPHHLLTWRGPRPATRIQERARLARYQLLAQCAATLGDAAIVTAHHADDQAETILFRMTRGSGVAGLAGMSRISHWENTAILRPLLDVPKTALEAFCQAAGHDFFRDPSNADNKYARARLRTLAPTLAAQGLDREALLRLGARAARADEALVHCTATLRRQAIRHADDVSAQFDKATLAAATPEILRRLIGREIGRLAPKAPLRLERLERLADQLHASFAAGVAWRGTMAGLIVESRADALMLRPAPPRSRPGDRARPTTTSVAGAPAAAMLQDASLGKKPCGA